MKKLFAEYRMRSEREGLYNSPLPESGVVEINDQNKDSVLFFLAERFGIWHPSVGREMVKALYSAQQSMKELDELEKMLLAMGMKSPVDEEIARLRDQNEVAELEHMVGVN
jgi:hypothetical protein